MTIPAPVFHAIQTLQEWVKELRDKGELADEAAAYMELCTRPRPMRMQQKNISMARRPNDDNPDPKAFA